MDVPVNKTHRILLDAALPSTIEDLKNPTEDYIANLLMTFLSRFYINMSVIDQPFSEQYDTMPYYNDSNIINLINLYAVLTPIFDKIYLIDFCITDITSSGQKRFRRQAKFLANFILYTMQKKLEVNDKIDDIQSRFIQLKEFKDEKTAILESVNDKAVYTTKQLNEIEMIENDIQHMRLKLEQQKKKNSQLEATQNDINPKFQKIKEHYDSVKTIAENNFKNLAIIEMEIVEMPEEYRLRLEKYEKEMNSKVEERNIMQEAIQERKESIKQRETKINVVQRVKNEFASLELIYKQFRNEKAQLNNIRKEIDSLNNIQNGLENKITVHKNEVNTEKNHLQSYHKKDMAPIYDMYNQLLSEKKLNKVQLETGNVYFNEKCLEKNELERNIKKTEEEITTFLCGCQEMYNNEIANELELQNVWKK